MLNSALKFGLLSLSSLLGKKTLIFYTVSLCSAATKKVQFAQSECSVYTLGDFVILALGSAIESTVMRIYSITIWNIYLN